MKKIFGERYEIIRQVGGGGMSIVYLAKDLFLDRLVAVKVLRDEFVESDEFIKRFHKEAKAIAALNHPNIVNIYDFNANESPIYLVMEYVEGQTLKEKIIEEGIIREKDAIKIASQIASGLALAHSTKIIHKDIKSQNILLNSDGHVKITDFGIAQMLSSSTVTHNNKGILGSAHYFSPEQARGEIVTYKSDIYSLGIVLYEMLTGELPFTGDNPVTVALKHIQEKPLPPRALNPDISEDIEAIVLKCLSKHPDDRFNSMEDFLQSISRLNNSVNSVKIVPHKAPQTFEKNDYHYKKEPLPDKTDIRESSETSIVETTNKPKSKWMALLLLSLLSIIFMAVTVFVIGSFNSDSDEYIDMPNIVNLDIKEAEKLLKNFDLTIKETKEKFSKVIPEGTIMDQLPKDSEKVKRGSDISVIVSAGAENATVPNFIGMEQDEAENRLKRKDLKLGKITFEYSDDVEKNLVMKQSPVVGSIITSDDKINLVISLGSKEKKVLVPNLYGLNINDAKAKLSTLGLKIGEVSYSEDNAKSNGIILNQSIQGNEEVKIGTSIDLTVNKLNVIQQKDKEISFSFSVPNSGWLNIVQIDKKGSRTIYETNANAGDVIDQKIQYSGSGSIKVFIDNELVKEVSLS